MEGFAFTFEDSHSSFLPTNFSFLLEFLYLTVLESGICRMFLT